MTLVAVTTSKYVRGVDGTPEGDWRASDADRAAFAGAARAAGGDKHAVRAARVGVREAFVVVELVEALGREYDTDAHLVTYVVSRDGVPLVRQPRVNKPALEWVFSQGYELACDVLFVDLDNPEHAEWTDPAAARARELYATLPALASAGVYHTQHGARLVQPLDEPVSVVEVERYLEAWLDELEAAGLAPDRACRDWTRLFRLPHVRRGRVDYRSPHVDLSRMVPRRITPVPLRPKAEPRARSRGAPPLARWGLLSPSHPAGRAAST